MIHIKLSLCDFNYVFLYSIGKLANETRNLAEEKRKLAEEKRKLADERRKLANEKVNVANLTSEINKLKELQGKICWVQFLVQVIFRKNEAADFEALLLGIIFSTKTWTKNG